MSSLLIVGADHLGNIKEKLSSIGFEKVQHITGRQCQAVKREIPEDAEAVLVLIDYVNHNLSKVIKHKAKEQEVPVYFAKRSWCSIERVLTGYKKGCQAIHNFN